MAIFVVRAVSCVGLDIGVRAAASTGKRVGAGAIASGA